MVHTDNEKRGQSERPVWDGQGSGRRSPPAVLIPSPTVDLQPGTGDHGAAAMELGLGRAPAVKAPAATEVGKGERRPGRERGGQGGCLIALAGGGWSLHGWGGGRWSFAIEGGLSPLGTGWVSHTKRYAGVRSFQRFRATDFGILGGRVTHAGRRPRKIF
jgi:hypothetical protein